MPDDSQLLKALTKAVDVVMNGVHDLQKISTPPPKAKIETPDPKPRTPNPETRTKAVDVVVNGVQVSCYEGGRSS